MSKLPLLPKANGSPNPSIFRSSKGTHDSKVAAAFVEKIKRNTASELAALESESYDEARLGIIRNSFAETIRHLKGYAPFLSFLQSEYESYIDANSNRWYYTRTIEQQLAAMQTATPTIQQHTTGTQTEAAPDPPGLRQSASFSPRSPAIAKNPSLIYSTTPLPDSLRVTRDERDGSRLNRKKRQKYALPSIETPKTVEDGQNLPEHFEGDGTGFEAEMYAAALLEGLEVHVISHELPEFTEFSNTVKCLRRIHRQNLERHQLLCTYKDMIVVLLKDVEIKTSELKASLAATHTARAECGRLQAECEHMKEFLANLRDRQVEGEAQTDDAMHRLYLDQHTEERMKEANTELKLLERKIDSSHHQVEQLLRQKADLKTGLRQASQSLELLRKLDSPVIPAATMPTRKLELVPPPVGTIVLVFSDIQGSTKMWESHTKIAGDALVQHNNLFRACLKAHGGYEVKTQGDSFMISWNDPIKACKFCLAIQDQLRDLPINALMEDIPETRSQKHVFNGEEVWLWRGLRVRMGIHMGECHAVLDPITNRMDYFGPMVNKSSRVEAHANGGIVCFTDEIHEVVVDHLDEFPNVEIRSVGEFLLKGIAEPVNFHYMLQAELAERIDQLARQTELKRELQVPEEEAELPPPQQMAIVVLKLNDEQLERLKTDLSPACLDLNVQLYLDTANELVGRYEGQPGQNDLDRRLLVFPSVEDAARFCLELQSALLNAKWSDDLLAHPAGKPTCSPGGSALTCGLQVQCSIHWGIVEVMENPLTEQPVYIGKTAKETASICLASQVGEILVSQEAHSFIANLLPQLGDPWVVPGPEISIEAYEEEDSEPILTLLSTFAIYPEPLLTRTFVKQVKFTEHAAKLEKEVVIDYRNVPRVFSALYHHFKTGPLASQILPMLEESRMGLEDRPQHHPPLPFKLIQLMGLHRHFHTVEDVKDEGDGEEEGRPFSKYNKRRQSLQSMKGLSVKKPEGPNNIEHIYRLHQHTRNFFQLLRSYMTSVSESEKTGSLPMQETEFVEKWIGFYRDVENKHTKKKKEKRSKQEFKEQIMVALDSERDERMFKDDLQKLYRSIIGVYGKFFVFLRGSQQRKRREPTQSRRKELQSPGPTAPKDTSGSFLNRNKSFAFEDQLVEVDSLKKINSNHIVPDSPTLS
eukprot:NODE_65_length_3545_cov_17.143944_g60_i0.p1 GENE.NODE_65_length_3545_cov_17.143944_g60_i0~~NODE_65_length_3545_cov_17.143944_g60_i0.p1  ORF type:complete len:1163 (-),score=361.05 NODE_65_length_3545_cov_17.143944_g60_i0:57-3521(-)